MEGIAYSIKRVFEKIRRKEGLFDLIKCFYYEFKLAVYKPLFKSSWSGHFEDVTIDKLLGNKKKGFYVDVGAYDPQLGNNTKRFYNKGWSGINIEPDFERYNNFVKQRERDINLNIGISNTKSTLTFYQMFPESISTFSKKQMKLKLKEGFKLISTKTVEVKRLEDVLNKFKVKNIDFISIDTEGLDFNVLEGINWNKTKPKVICIEDKDTKIEKYLFEKGYSKYIEYINNRIYYRD